MNANRRWRMSRSVRQEFTADIASGIELGKAEPVRVVLHAEVDPAAMGTDKECLHFTVTGLDKTSKHRECVMMALTGVLVQAKRVYGDTFVEELVRNAETVDEAPEESPTLEE
jgi:hypothetical protein